jgi:hypothetical protein
MALTPPQMPQPAPGDVIPSTLASPGAAPFWLAVLLTGIGTGVAAAALTRLRPRMWKSYSRQVIAHMSDEA